MAKSDYEGYVEMESVCLLRENVFLALTEFVFVP